MDESTDTKRRLRRIAVLVHAGDPPTVDRDAWCEWFKQHGVDPRGVPSDCLVDVDDVYNRISFDVTVNPAGFHPDRDGRGVATVIQPPSIGGMPLILKDRATVWHGSPVGEFPPALPSDFVHEFWTEQVRPTTDETEAGDE